MRTILHSDLNNFYATVECMLDPTIRDFPVVVCGDAKSRHGIVLAKNYIAKSAGVKTGDVIWEAQQKCKDLVVLTANFPIYLEYSKKVKQIYYQYTDQIESFGIDEAWLDVTACKKLHGSGEEIATKIKEQVKKELGITVSVGVSFNKIFAKLASDTAQRDGIFVINEQNFRKVVWEKPVEELLYVGRATKSKLNSLGIMTIGELANTPKKFLTKQLGKWGDYLHTFANGEDVSPVMKFCERRGIKSLGNSLTNYKDLTSDDEIKTLIFLLAESVGARLRQNGLGKAQTICIFAKDSKLQTYAKRQKMLYPTLLSAEIGEYAYELFKQLMPTYDAIRALGVSVSDFVCEKEQLTMENCTESYYRKEKLEKAIDQIRKKFGNNSLQKAIVKTDKKLQKLDIKDEHVIHPENYFKS